MNEEGSAGRKALLFVNLAVLSRAQLVGIGGLDAEK
jgi:hypothetical protein